MNNFIKINDFLQNNNPIPLKTNFIAIFEHLAKLGKVSTTLFSNSLNHTVQGKFADMHSRNNTLMHFHPNIDTRLFTAKWRYVYATEQDKIVCLHFFSRYGDLIYRVCSTSLEQYPQLKKFISKYASKETSSPDITESFTKPKHAKPINKELLTEQWATMTNVHQASKIFKYNGNDPITVYTALGKNYALKISAVKLIDFFSIIAKHQLNLMMFSRNYAAVQCYVGSISKLICFDGKIEISITDFNFIMRVSQLGDIWLITKPTDNGFVNSINIFDKTGNENLILTDKRTKSEPESDSWLKSIQQIK